MQGIVQWIHDDALYCFAGLLGLALGVFYGFDGWLGSTAETEFQNSPRTKNLVWMLTGAVATVIGDVKAVDPNIKKPLLLFIYGAAALVGAGAVVGGWGAFVLFDNLRARRHLGSEYGPIDALGDYLYFGYRKYRERKQEFNSKQKRNFHLDYLTQLAYSITAAGSKITPEQQLTVARNILRSMKTVVKQYRGESATAEIRTNLMFVRTCTPELAGRLKFHAEGVSMQHCLELVAYDVEEELHDLVLPLPVSHAQGCLPGAPSAVLDANPVIIDDTRQISFTNGLSPEVQEAVREYFASHEAKLRSFASLRIVSDGRAIAVVNIDSSETNVFGQDESDKKEIVEYLFPFCSAMGILLRGSEA